MIAAKERMLIIVFVKRLKNGWKGGRKKARKKEVEEKASKKISPGDIRNYSRKEYRVKRFWRS